MRMTLKMVVYKMNDNFMITVWYLYDIMLIDIDHCDYGIIKLSPAYHPEQFGEAGEVMLSGIKIVW